MFDLKKMFIDVFKSLKEDVELLELIGLRRSDFETENDFLVALRKQMIDAEQPDDLLNNYSIRLCIHESDGGYTTQMDEIGFLSIDIHVSQDQDVIDRRHLKIQKRIVEVLDTKERKKRGLSPVPIGLFGLTYKKRPANLQTNSTGWVKHSVLFEFKYLII